MKKKLSWLLLSGTILTLLFSCRDNNDDVTPESSDDEVSEEIIAINDWIYENMDAYYLWNGYLPTDIDNTKESDPESYFYKLIYDSEDKWSWITDDYASLAAEFSGTQVTMGYSPAFYLLSDGSSVVIAVEYVYPGSAAEDAGLERGDIILSIDNTDMDTTNYYDLYSGTSYSVQLGSIQNNTLYSTGESLDLTARSTITDPAIYHDVLDINGSKIGYLVYAEFVSGDNNVFLSSLDDIFTEFNSEGISGLVVDLRYNPGGDIDAACHLASEIAPYSVITNQEILVKMQYNNDLQEYLEYYGSMYEDYLYYRFTNDVTNANLQTVYFLTTSGTASASELVISGLEPYMTVVQIGESTYGKYTGMWVIPDDNEEWAMLPVVMKYSNINGYTDFADGISPDYEIDDDLFSAVPFGDTSDPMLAKAIELITGTTVKTAKTKSSIKSSQIVPQKMKLKKNLFNKVNPVKYF